MLQQEATEDSQNTSGEKLFPKTLGKKKMEDKSELF